MTVEVINPATGKINKVYDLMNQEQVETVLQSIETDRLAFQKTSLNERAGLLKNVAQVLREKANEWALTITREMGKPITQALGEIEKCALLCEFYAEHGPAMITDEVIETEFHKSFVCYQPLGIIFAIMPWNFPFWQVLRFAVPNLLAGNAAVLSHAPNSTGAALAIEKIFRLAGFPQNCFRSLIIDVDLASFVINHDLVRGVTLTGSDRAGRAVASQAGQALKKTVLELGGSDPAVILEDADLELAAEQIVMSRLSNAGQVCVSAKRIIMVEAIQEELQALILEKAKHYVCGDPADPKTTLGPMARDDLRKQLADQVDRCKAAGADCLLGGELPEGEGCFYPATVLGNIQPGSPALTEELFGPVICLITVKDEAEALVLANDTIYGLGATVYTQDLEKGAHIAAHVLEAGCCTVNKMVASDPRLPFGGIKQSGYGRELWSAGLHEFMNVKSVVVA
jgi:succinate-semialdehyde dehydrogenase/glutarate-semialdehyde dehydrogenase